MSNRAIQELLEMQFNRKLVQEQVTASVLSIPNFLEVRDAMVHRLEEFANKKYTYDSKNQRMELLRAMDLQELCGDLLCRVAMYVEPTMLSTVVGQLEGFLGWDSKYEAAVTLSEILAVLAPLGVFDMYKETNASSIKILSRIPICPVAKINIGGGLFLPPMVCKPDVLTTNTDSGYLTVSESLILNNNHHDEELGLDVLNTMNSVKLSLNVEFLQTVPEEPTFEIQDQEQLQEWERFLEQSRNVYGLMLEHGNQFHLTHKVDKRGRIYARGYHINTQGTSYKKAMLDLADKELVEVPVGFFN